MKKRLTLKEHAEIGVRLAEMHDELVHHYCTYYNYYPLSDKTFNKLDKIEKLLSEFRWDMVNKLAKEFPETQEKNWRAIEDIYFPMSDKPNGGKRVKADFAEWDVCDQKPVKKK